MVAALVLASLLAAPPPPVTVRPTAALDCPSTAALDRALARGGAASSTAAAWTLSVEAAAAAPSRPGATLALVVRLTEPGGRPALVRTLTVADPGCETAADAVAIVVERYFRELVWTAGLPPPAPSTAPARATAGTAAGRKDDRPPRFVLSLGPALWSRRSFPVAAALEGRARLGGPVSAAAVLLAPAATTTERVPGGSAALVAWPLLVRFLAERSLGPASLSAGLDSVLTLERGETTGITQPASKRRVVLAGGAMVGLSIPVARAWRVYAEASGHRTLLGHSFEVQNLRGRVLEPAPWQALVAVRLGWVVVP